MTKELSAQIAKYESLRDVLEADHVGEWLLMYDEQTVGYYDSFEAAAEVAVSKYGRGPYLIRQIGVPPATLPASLLLSAGACQRLGAASMMPPE